MKIFKQNQDMSFINITNKIRLQKILLVSICILYFLSSFRNEVKFVEKEITIKDTIYLQQDIKDIELTEEEVLKELIKQGCILPNVALAQAKIESAHFKSAITKENKNIFGVKTSNSEFVKKDSNGKAVKNRDHNVFESYKMCIKEYVRIQNRYLKNINGKYAGDSGYIQKIKTVK